VKLQAMLGAIVTMIGLSGGPMAAAQDGAMELVRKECSACHGPHGVSVAPTFPNLAGQPAPYLEAQLKAFRDRSRADPHAQAFMWGMAAQLTDTMISEIATFFASQPPAPGRTADPTEVAAGKKIFEEGIEAQKVPPCKSCHGDKAQGNGPFPRLAGQHRSYLERQLEVFATNLRANPIMHENAKNLTALQISQVAAFLSAQ
jgi:cytochrome c553